MRVQNKEVLFGLYDDDEVLLHAVDSANADHLDIMDVQTPFPVHGLDPKLGLSESRLHIAGFFYGLCGFCVALGFMTWVFTRDWPIIFAGKPYFSLPSFIPITFELTVLFSAVGMVITFFTICGLGPGIENPILHERITDDKFCIAFDVTDKSDEEKHKIESFFKKSHAVEVHTKVI